MQLNMDITRTKENIDDVTEQIKTSTAAANNAPKEHSCSCKATVECHGIMTWTTGDQVMECPVCKGSACTQCHVHLRAGGINRHVCDPDTLATVQEILNSSKPCPTCGTHIQKSEGEAYACCTARTSHMHCCTLHPAVTLGYCYAALYCRMLTDVLHQVPLCV